MTLFFAAVRLLLFLIPVCILALFLLTGRFFWQVRTAALLTGSANQLKYFSRIKKALKALLLTLGLFSLVLALARPQWNKATDAILQEGRDLLIAVDISRSMAAQDVMPSRLEVAKQKIKKMIDRLPADRFSLIVFSGSAIVLCPFTRDVQAFLTFLDSLEPEMMSAGSTALDKAVAVAIQSFKLSPRKHKTMIVLTDGEDFSQGTISTVEQAHREGVRVFTWAIGTPEGAPIPLFNEQGEQEGHQKDAKGAIVISKLNEPLLQQIAQKSGGMYERITASEDDIATFLKTIQKIEKEELPEQQVVTLQEQYFYFAACSLLFLALEWVL